MRRVMLATLLSGLCATAGAQEYATPSDHQSIETSIQDDLQRCLSDSAHYDTDLSCAEAVLTACLRLSPHGETTVGYSICGGVTSNVLDREMNTAWARLKANVSRSRFQDVLHAQRNWLAYRSDEMQAAARRYPSGSMSAYSGWVRYNVLSAHRVARLYEIARNGA